MFGAPSQNFVYADVDGHIGYQLPGAIPVRTLATDIGDRPVPGWDGQHEWESYVPFDDLPSVFDPPSGRIATANNAVYSDKAFIGAEYDRGDRAARILELIDAAGNKVSLDTFAAIQGDTTLRRAARLTPALLDLKPAPATRDGGAVLEAISRWDGRCDTTSTGCSAYLVFENALVRAIFDDELGPLARDYVGADVATDLAATLLGTPEGLASAWWGDAKTGRKASPADVVAAALDAAGSQLRRDLGEPSGWTWGRIHTIQFRESTLGDSGIAPLEWYFNSPGAAVNGADGAVDNNYYRLSRAYPDPYDPDFEPAATLGGAVLGHERPVDARAVRHERPGRRPDHHDHRPERRAVQPSRERLDPQVAGQRDGSAAVHGRGHRRRGGRDPGAHAEPLTHRDAAARHAGVDPPGPTRGRAAPGPRVPWATMARDRDPLIGTLAAIVAAVLFGTLGPLSRFGAEAGVGGVAFTAWRAILGVAFLAILVTTRGAAGSSVAAVRGLPGAGGQPWRRPRSWASPSTSRCSRPSGWCPSPSP